MDASSSFTVPWQVASVMGTSFTAALLAVVHPIAREPADLADDLGALAAARFVRPDDGAADAWSWCQVRRPSATWPGAAPV